MIKISNLNVPVDFSENYLRLKASGILGIPTDGIKDLSLSRLSVDARKKSDVHYVCTILLSAENEEMLVNSTQNKNVELFAPKQYVFPKVTRKSQLAPIVVGMGPAGLFAALQLARAGLKPIVLERGRNVTARTEDVERFWKTGSLLNNSNVQFGEGGAGTFSDGKLSTGTNDPRISHVFETFVEHGAPRDIIWSNRPHIGTDVLRDVVQNMRRELISLGCDIRFENILSGVEIENGTLVGVFVDSHSGTYKLPCDCLVLAPGHSARDTFAMLFEAGIPMEQKPFAIGVRIEHKQKTVSESQYGDFAKKLPPADYKLACHLPSGRSAFTFCVCPGGQVVAAASESGQLVTNGMSMRARDGENINSGLLVGVSPSDFGDTHPLGGMRFQEHWEKQAYILGGGDYCAPIQLLEDFMAKRASSAIANITPTYKPGVKLSDLRKCLPKYVADTLAEAIPIFDRSLRGFADPNAVMTGVETRSSSPVRVLRGDDFQSKIRGIFPCGEGAGYAGGITSAAVDGIKVAEAVVTM